MITYKILPFLVVTLLSGCSKISTTEEDKKSVETIQQFYGGRIETNKGVEAINGHSDNYFEVIVKGSKLIDSQPQRAISNTANIAFMVYENQDAETYDIIKSKIILPDGTNISKSYTKKELQEVKAIYPEIEKFNKFLTTKNYNGILEMFDPKFRPEEKLVRNTLTTFDSDMGDIKRIQFQGFEFIDDAKLGHTILVREVSERNNTFPFINVAFNRGTGKILNIEFP
ncbi:TPA: hypothetical protein ACG0AO_002754 [Elizabethkingia meningoseptica]